MIKPTSIEPDEVLCLADFMYQVSVRLTALEILARKHSAEEFDEALETAKGAIASPNDPGFRNMLNKSAASCRK